MNKRTPAPELEPLWKKEHWRVTGVRDSTLFFGALHSLCPEATSLVLEGQDIAPAVRKALEPFLEIETTVVPPGTEWPNWRYAFRYSFSDRLLATLGGLSERHAEPELCMHLFVARHSEVLLQWWDAFDNDMLVAAELRVRLFCAKTAGKFEHVAPAV